MNQPTFLTQAHSPDSAELDFDLPAPSLSVQNDTPCLRIGFLALGEAHQLFHVMGPAIELARLGHSVTFLVASVWHQRVLARHTQGGQFQLQVLRTLPQGRAPKISTVPYRLFSILFNAGALPRFDVIVTPERSSTLIKRLGFFRGMLAHIPHGAGDRAAGYDKRIRYFDCVIVAGEKDRDRMIARELVAPDTCVVGGYAKFDVLQRPVPFFDNDKPIVLYNPHFDKRLSSWPELGEALLEKFSADDAFNYVIAPHIRMRGAIRRSFERLASQNSCSHIRFDEGSLHSINMDYTRAASIYLGDVSSQVYEFIRTPRPCVFLNRAGVDWRTDEHFTHWRFGDVAGTVDEAMSSLKAAQDKHEQYREVQSELYSKAIVECDAPASPRIAAALLDQYRLWRRGRM